MGIVGTGAAYYYSQSGKSKRGGGRTSTRQAESTQRRGSESVNDSRDARKRKGKAKAPDTSDQVASKAAEVNLESSPAGSTEKVKRRKGEKQQPSKLAHSSAIDVNNEQEADHNKVDEEDEEMSNKEFAKHLSGLKTGTSLKKPDTMDKGKGKSERQGKSEELRAEATNGAPLKPNRVIVQDMSTASSTTGADADDDLSLPVSPELGAIQATTPSGRDVSDMLEAPSKGPSVLRITQSAKPQAVRQPKQPKIASEPETKKQRQNRQKNEERKAMREQAEKERRVLLEKQLRTAREAEGRPARNGMNVSKAPSTSAWDKTVGSSAETAAGAVNEKPNLDNDSLLDTLDGDKSFLGQTRVQLNAGPNDLWAEDSKVWNRDLPSEEEQLRLITKMDSDNTWNTVAKGGKGKKKSTKILPANANTSLLNNDNLASADRDTLADSKTPTASGGSKMLDPLSSGVRQDDASVVMNNMNKDDLNTSLANTSSNSGSDKTDTSSMTSTSEKSKYEGVEPGHSTDEPEERAYYKDSAYHGGVPPSVSKRWRAIAKDLDRSVWNYDNIHEHPDYDPDWPYALTGHPKDSDWAGNWDADDMKRATEKRAKEEAAQKAKNIAQKGKE